MAAAYSILGQSNPAAATNTDLFSVTSAHSYVVSSLVVTNVTTSATNCRVYARKAGAAAAVGNAIIYDASIPANSTVTFTLGITLSGSAGDLLTVYSLAANALTFTAFGSDNT